MNIQKLRAVLALSGDIAILYGTLFLTLLFRYGQTDFLNSFNAHLKPFSIIFAVWILIFYLADLYSNKFFKHNLTTLRIFITSVIVSLVISIIIFYAFEPIFKLTPKTNLLIFAVIFGMVDYFWRLILVQFFISGGWQKQLLIIGNSPNIASIADYLKENPQTGHQINLWLKEDLIKEKFSDLTTLIAKNKIETIIISDDIKKNPLTVKLIYQLLPLEIKIYDASDFSEMIFQKVPLEELGESWFIESIATSRHMYDAVKKAIDIILSLILIIVFLPVMAAISILIKITSSGPIIYKQERIGKNNRPFILYKFRTMITGNNGPLWTNEKDKRLTFIGRILRYTHLDELPQLYNILKGDISFIGPRPERSELVEIYKKLPYYEIRHIIKPGLTGWAQLNYKPSASLEEAFEKLQYDIYYIKNRSLFLDFLIILKTIKYIFVSHQ